MLECETPVDQLSCETTKTRGERASIIRDEGRNVDYGPDASGKAGG